VAEIMDEDEGHVENVLDGLYSAMATLYEIDNDLVPESERIKIACVGVVLMVVTNMLCGNSVDRINDRVLEIVREKADGVDSADEQEVSGAEGQDV